MMQYVFYEKYDIEVEITLLHRPGEADKSFPSMFGGLHVYLDNYELVAYFVLKDREMLHVGETAQAFVTFAQPALLIGRLWPDKTFRLHEGYRLIGEGRILSVLNFDQHVEEEQRREKEKLKIKFSSCRKIDCARRSE